MISRQPQAIYLHKSCNPKYGTEVSVYRRDERQLHRRVTDESLWRLIDLITRWVFQGSASLVPVLDGWTAEIKPKEA